MHALLLKISPASTSPRLSNDRTFPNFIRTVSSDAEIAIGIVQAMKQYGWSRIALITQSENIFTFVSCCRFDQWSKKIDIVLWDATTRSICLRITIYFMCATKVFIHLNYMIYV